MRWTHKVPTLSSRTTVSHPSDVVAVWVGQDRDVNVAGSVPVVEVVDDGISRGGEARVDHDVRQPAGLGIGEPKSYRVAVPASVAPSDELDFPHVRNLLFVEVDGSQLTSTRRGCLPAFSSGERHLPARWSVVLSATVELRSRSAGPGAPS